VWCAGAEKEIGSVDTFCRRAVGGAPKKGRRKRDLGHHARQEGKKRSTKTGGAGKTDSKVKKGAEGSPPRGRYPYSKKEKKKKRRPSVYEEKRRWEEKGKNKGSYDDGTSSNHAYA